MADFLDVHDVVALNQKTSARGFLRMARDFLRTFELLPPDQAPLEPKLFLAAHMLECTLKAYVALVDDTKLKVKGREGHDLLEQWKVAVEVSNVAAKKLPIDVTPPEWIKTLAAFHAYPYLNRPAGY
jgi:hypothetical protein